MDWERRVIKLRDSKGGKRDVPLSPAAIEALKALESGADHEPVVRISYESMRAAWRRAGERAGIKNLKIHDLRHTAATRMALKTGNVFLVRALTGHKTMEMLARYVNVTADDVVDVMHGNGTDAGEEAKASAPTPVSAPTPASVVEVLPQEVASSNVFLTRCVAGPDASRGAPGPHLGGLAWQSLTGPQPPLAARMAASSLSKNFCVMGFWGVAARGTLREPGLS